MSLLPHPPEREQTFRALYEAIYPDLLRFVQRRAHPDQAEDIVADAFLVVWRRHHELPPGPDDARAWIYGIARNLLLNARRADQRRLALGVRLADTASISSHDLSADMAINRVDLGRAWRALSEVHQETLGLAIFDELTAPQAAAVIGISPVAYRLRLSRARKALRLHLAHMTQSNSSPAAYAGRTNKL